MAEEGPHHGHGDDEFSRKAGKWVARRTHGAMLERPRTFWGKVRQFLWGFFFFEWYHELHHEKSRYQDLFTLIIYGQLLGLPLMNSAIGLRLLPYVLPELPGWKHRQLEEFDLVEHGPHLH